MPLFETAEALTDFLENMVAKTLDHVGGIIEIVVRKNIYKEVYDPYGGLVRIYKRRYEDGGFVGSWTHEVGISSEGDFHVIVFSDPQLMTGFEPPTHTKFYERSSDVYLDVLDKMNDETGGTGDRRSIMDAAIAEGRDYDFYVPGHLSPYGDPPDNWWTRPRDYFSPSLRKIDREKSVEKTAEAALRRNNPGIKIKKVVT